MATKLQTAVGYNTSSSTNVPTQTPFGAAPTTGNMLVLRGVAGASFDTPSGYTLANRATDYTDTAIFYKVASGSESTGPTFTISSGAPGAWQLEEWSGVTGLDVSASANTASALFGTPVSCGTTGTTSQNDTIAFALLGSLAAPSSINSGGVTGWLDGFSADDEHNTTFAVENVYCSLGSKVLTTTGAVTAQATFANTAQHFSGAVAVFTSAASSNQTPVADAGPDQTNIEPFSTVTLAGSGTDADGTITGYNWSQVSGPSVTLSSTTAQNPTFTAPGALTSQVCVFGLTVTDDQSATSGQDTVSISILPATEFMASSASWVAFPTRRSAGTWQ